MSHALPEGLSPTKRKALSEFYAGHLSAGELSARLRSDEGQSASEPPAQGERRTANAPGSAAPAARQPSTRWRLNWLGAVLAVTVAGGALGVAAGLLPGPAPTAAVAAHRPAARPTAPRAVRHRRHPTSAKGQATAGPQPAYSDVAPPGRASAPAKAKHRPAHTTRRKAATRPRERNRTDTPHRTTRTTTSTTTTSTTTTSTTAAGGPPTNTNTTTTTNGSSIPPSG